MWSKFKRWFLTIIGDIKYYKYPMWLVYAPTTYAVKGSNYIDVSMYIMPGDIVIRGYSDYVDGLFIPGDYSHAGLYIGGNRIIHAIAEGVCYDNLIDFMRCDRILIMRPKNYEYIHEAIEFCEDAVYNNIQYDFDFSEGNRAYYCFELVAKAYNKLSIKKNKVVRFLGLYKKNLYTSSSFIDCLELERIYEYNPRRKVSYNKFENR